MPWNRSKRVATAVFFVCAVMPATLVSQDKSSQPSSAQTNSPFKISVSTNIVLVPVVVSDKRGQHVPGLKADDFEIREDGQAQKIAGFEEISAESAPVQRVVVAPNSFSNQIVAAHPKKLEIILLDLLNTPISGRAEARRGLIAFLSKSADPDNLVSLLVLAPNGVHMIHNFTVDSSVLVAAVHKMQGTVASRDTPGLNTNGGNVDAEAGELQAIFNGESAAATMGQHATPGKGIAMLRGDEALSDVSRQDQEAKRTLECMEQIARYFAAVPGRKSLFWASTGFRFSIDTLARESTRGASPDDWQRAMRMLQDANIAVYPVDLGGVGLMGEGDATVHGEIPQNGGRELLETARLNDPSGGKHLTMDTIASMTGGRAFYNVNDSDDSFRRARQDSAQYYMLAYYAKDTGKSGWRKLSVRVHHEGVSVRSRSGFLSNNAAHDPDAKRQSDEIMAMTSALESTSLPISGQWQQVEPAGDQRKVHFALAIPPGAVVIDTEHENHVNLDFLVMAWNTDGKQAAQIGQRMDSKLAPADLTQIQAHGIDYTNILTLPPGEYDVHIVVRDNLKGSLGSVATHLKVE